MSVSLKVLNDYQRGAIPHFELPPKKNKQAKVGDKDNTNL